MRYILLALCKWTDQGRVFAGRGAGAAQPASHDRCHAGPPPPLTCRIAAAPAILVACIHCTRMHIIA